MKKRLSFILAISMIACIILSGCSSNGVSSQIDARNGVVVVESGADVADLDYHENWGQGTGFFVDDAKNPKYLVTNHHVIADYLESGSGEPMIGTLYGQEVIFNTSIKVYYNSNDYDEAYVVDYDEKKDIAILRINTPTDKRVPLALLRPTDDMVGSTVYALGFPGLSDNDIFNPSSRWSTSDITVTAGSISRVMTSAGSGVRRVQINVDIGHGNSGGPLVNEKGQALGINSHGISQIFGVSESSLDVEFANYAVDISEVIDMLKKNGIDFIDADNSSNLIIWIIAGAAAVLIVVVIVIVAVNAANKDKDKTNTGDQDAVQTSTDTGYRLQGIAGVHAGKRYAVMSGKPMLLGRSAGSAIVFPDGTPGVSGTHCTVWADGGKLFVRDNSQHGTLVNQNKLSKGQTAQLNVGDNLGIGSQKELFVVSLKGGV